jgi:hypothetical protein
VGLESNIALSTAALDLKLVQLIRGAMAAADAQGGGSASGAAATFEPRLHVHPQTKYENRPIIHPEPRYLARPIIHPTPRLEPESNPPECEPTHPHKSSYPFQPPWQVVPWKQAPKVQQTQVKKIIKPPDILHKGSLIDCFI